MKVLVGCGLFRVLDKHFNGRTKLLPTSVGAFFYASVGRDSLGQTEKNLKNMKKVINILGLSNAVYYEGREFVRVIGIVVMENLVDYPLLKC